MSDAWDITLVKLFLLFHALTGERLDFVLKANQTLGNYWIKVRGLWDCEPSNAHGYAILHYNGYHGNERPVGDPVDFSTQKGVVCLFSFFRLTEMND